jgi:ubiquinone/menaquinone biosynthesis C-methylase UbiE
LTVVGDRTAQALEVSIRDWEAGGYASSYRRTVGLWWDELERALIVGSVWPRAGMRVLDAGSGVGRLTFALAAADCQVVALDFSMRSLRFLRIRSKFPPQRIITLAASLTDPLPIADESMDAVVSGQVVQHIPSGELRVRAWQHLARVTQRGGRLGAVLYKDSPGEESEGYFDSGLFFHRYTSVDLARELRSAGWEPSQMSAWYRRMWSSELPTIVPKSIETAAAASHVADHSARYLLVNAIRSA